MEGGEGRGKEGKEGGGGEERREGRGGEERREGKEKRGVDSHYIHMYVFTMSSAHNTPDHLL